MILVQIMMEIVDDESDDGDDGEVCFICEERGKDELWYKCTNCGLWVHSECRADTAENYTIGTIQYQT